jgi:hypothetical protein
MPDLVIPGRGLAREPGILEHRPRKLKDRPVSIDSGPGPKGHPEMTVAGVTESCPRNWHSFTDSKAGVRSRHDTEKSVDETNLRTRTPVPLITIVNCIGNHPSLHLQRISSKISPLGWGLRSARCLVAATRT